MSGDVHVRFCEGLGVKFPGATHLVCCFQYKEEANRFYAALKERLAKFELEIAENKSKIIEFGRFAAGNRQVKGLGKPETFDFLGFTHYCSQTRNGKYTVKRKTSKKKFKAKVKAFATWIRRMRDKERIQTIFETVKAKLQGHYNYYGISDNYRMIAKYYNRVIDLIFKWLNRRSQRESFRWDKFNLYLKQNPLPRPKIKRNLWVTG